jgi:hypothetical protein
VWLSTLVSRGTINVTGIETGAARENERSLREAACTSDVRRGAVVWKWPIFERIPGVSLRGLSCCGVELTDYLSLASCKHLWNCIAVPSTGRNIFGKFCTQ